MTLGFDEFMNSSMIFWMLLRDLEVGIGSGSQCFHKAIEGWSFRKFLGLKFSPRKRGFFGFQVIRNTCVFYHGWHIFVGARESSLYGWYEQIRIARPGPQNYGIEPGGAVHWWAVSLLVYVSNRDWTTKGDITRTSGGFTCLLVFFSSLVISLQEPFENK